MRFLRKIPLELIGALLFNIVLASLFLFMKSTPKPSQAPAEIEVDISNFSPPKPKIIPKLDHKKLQAASSKGENNAKVQSNEEIIAQSMQNFTPSEIPEAIPPGPSKSERKKELEQIMRRIKTFEGINSIKTSLPSGSLPEGHLIGESFQGRSDSEHRSRMLKRYGGEGTASAVKKALKYLASAQNPDGSWGSKDSFKTGDVAALSSLALLTFFAHGENFQSKQYAKTIQKGVDFLIKLSNRPDIESAGGGFGHAILTYALAEGYAVSASMSLRKPLEERIKAILMKQNKFGSFAVNYDNSPQAPPTEKQLENPLSREIVVGEPSCDLSLLGWHIQAMTAALNAGIDVEGLEKALKLATEALVKIHQAERGGFSQGINMKRFPANEDMNPVGLCGLLLLNCRNSLPARRAERLLREVQLPKWANCGRFPLYRWYYQTQAIFQSEKGKGKRWKEWNENLKKELIKVQGSDGSWSLSKGNKGFRVKNKDDLCVYATSLCSLMLQVYYRYLPSYSIAEADKISGLSADDLDLGMSGLITKLPGGADPLAAVILGFGATEMKPVYFGKFNGKPLSNKTPLLKNEFSIYASFKSTIPVRKETDWPQTLQPNQRIAIFFEDLIPRNFSGHLAVTLGIVCTSEDFDSSNFSLEATINGKRLYNSYILREKQLVELVIPNEYLEPYGNICQIRNNGKSVLAFDCAEIKAINKVGNPIYLLTEDKDLPNDIQSCFNKKTPKDPVKCKLVSSGENRQLLTSVKDYSRKKTYLAEWECLGSERMGNEFQLHYLRKSGREIVDWIAGGGSGVVLNSIMSGGKFFDSVFATEYPAASALRQVAKLFEGSPRKLLSQILPTCGEKPLYSCNTAAAYNNPGVATVVITRRFPVPEEVKVLALLPWSGETEMTVEEGFFKENSPFVGMARKLKAERKTIDIKNNTFQVTGVFPEMTVIRLQRKGATLPPKNPDLAKYIPKKIEFDRNTAKVLSPRNNTKLKSLPLRKAKNFASVYGENASVNHLPATVVESGLSKFTPKEKQSIELTFRANASKKDRHDSIFLTLGNGPQNPQFLSFHVFARYSGIKKKKQHGWVPLRFAIDNRCFATSVAVGRWRQIIVPLTKTDINPYWKSVRFLEPGNIHKKKLTAVSYEINNMSVLCQ